MERKIIILLLIVTCFSKLNAQHFFQNHSTWYEKIPENPELVVNSANYVDDIIINSSILTISCREWSVPVWYSDGNTNYLKVITRGDSRPAANDWDIIPIPPEARPAAAGDGHMVIISHDRRYEWDFYQATRNGEKDWIATHIRRWDLMTDGINSPYDGQGSCRVAPVPLSHGLINYKEIQEGYIDHALAFAYWGQRLASNGKNDIYPCEKSNGGINSREWALHLGFRLQLNPNLDIESLGLNRAAKIIAKALQEYGMIYVENNGKGYNSVYAECLDAKNESWNAIFDASISKIPIEQFRVVIPIYPDNNMGLSATINTSLVSGNAPLQVIFSCNANGGTPPYSFSWDFGDGVISTQQNPSHIYTQIGNYVVVLTVRDNDGTSATNSVTIHVIDPSVVLSIKDIKFTVPGENQGITQLERETWYDLYLYFHTPNGWSEIAFVDVWINSSAYTEGTIENRGSVFHSASSYVMSFSIGDNDEGIWTRQTEGSSNATNVTGTLGLYVDDRNHEYEINSTEGWAKVRIKLLAEAESGEWSANAYVKSKNGINSTLYKEYLIVISQPDIIPPSTPQNVAVKNP